MEITSFKNSVLCGELTDFFITINGGLDLESKLVIKLKNQKSGTLRNIICEYLDDKYRVTYCLSTPGRYRISILINGNIVESRDVRGKSNDRYKESMAQTELLVMSRLDESYQRMERERHTFLNLCAYKSVLKAELNRTRRDVISLQEERSKFEYELARLKNKLDNLPAIAPEDDGARR